MTHQPGNMAKQTATSIGQHPAKSDKVTVAKKLVLFYTMTQLAAHEGFIQFIHSNLVFFIQLLSLLLMNPKKMSELPMPPNMKYHK
jgi:hypothetical protein